MLFFTATQVNGVDFGHFTREEAAMFLMNIRAGQRIDILTQNKMDSEYRFAFLFSYAWRNFLCPSHSRLGFDSPQRRKAHNFT